MAYEQSDNNEFQPIPLGQGDLEGLLDAIADALIQSPLIDTTTVENNQKFIRSGLIQTGQEGGGTLALYQKDVEANVEDDLQSIADRIYDDELVTIVVEQGGDFGVTISINGGGFPTGGQDITNLVIGDGNPLNVSQFIPLEKQKSNVNVEQAEEFLDTNIFELLPTSDTRQARIIRFFQELNALIPPTPPSFSDPIQRDNIYRDWVGGEQYSRENSISYSQENPDGIEEEEAFLHRLKSDSINNPDSLAKPNETNSVRTIEDIYNIIKPYLGDILEDPTTLEDSRPEYQNQSSGYLQFRNLNQGIIIRNTNQEFVEGLDPNNPTWLDNGFTITMWVRFLDKSSQGTLFNYGNPMRSKDYRYNLAEGGFGFKLETYVINRDDRTLYPEGNDQTLNDARYTFGSYSDTRTGGNYISPTSGKAIFENTDSARFVRLVVNGKDPDEGMGWLHSSEVGTNGFPKYTWNMPDLPGSPQYQKSLERFGVNGNWGIIRAINATHIPEDFNEWYFICASFNPSVIEPDRYNTFGDDDSGENQLYYGGNGIPFNATTAYWMNHVNPLDPNNNQGTGNYQFTDFAPYGNQCKVEIISRTELLRARGFKVD